MARYLLIASGIFSLFACSKQREGIVRNIPFPGHDPKLAVTAILTESDSIVYASAYQSAGVLDSAGSVPAQDAVLTIEWGGTAAWSWSGSEGKLEAVPAANWQWPDGGVVSLSGEAPNLPAVASQAVVPPPVGCVVDASFGWDTVSYPWSSEVFIEDHFKVSLTNHAGEADHYLLVFEQRYPEFETQWTAAWNIEANLSTAQRLDYNVFAGGYLIEDLDLDQTPFSDLGFVSIRSESELEGEVQWRLRVQSITPDLATHYESLQAFFSSQDNPFSEPASVFGNIEGGFGILGLCRELIFPLE